MLAVMHVEVMQTNKCADFRSMFVGIVAAKTGTVTGRHSGLCVTDLQEEVYNE